MTGRTLTGRTFGRLVVGAEDLSRKTSKHRFYECRCGCGAALVVAQAHLLSGHTTSCGCRKSESSGTATHRMTESREYASWCRMKSRCCNPDSTQYPWYGGRGIGICPRWLDSFEAFYADMGPRPIGHTLDRIDNDKDYGPANCRWASKIIQANNTRGNRRITANGQTKTMAEWARSTGVAYNVIQRRLIAGWPEQDAVLRPTTPPNERVRMGRLMGAAR